MFIFQAFKLEEQFEEDEKFYLYKLLKNSIGEAFASPIVIFIMYILTEEGQDE
jgi:hypothetical protein